MDDRVLTGHPPARPLPQRRRQDGAIGQSPGIWAWLLLIVYSLVLGAGVYAGFETLRYWLS